MTRPVVIPRARRYSSSSCLPLDRLIEPLIRRRGLVCITALPGGGKTTAIGWLLTALSPDRTVRLFDADHAEAALSGAQSSLAILACDHVPPGARPLDVFELTRWTADDCIEYLAGGHRERVASVMQRLSADMVKLDGSPELLAYVMDAMAEDESIATSRQAIGQLVQSMSIPEALRGRATSYCMANAGVAKGITEAPTELRADASFRWLRHDIVRRTFAGQWIGYKLATGEVLHCLEHMLAAPILGEIVEALSIYEGGRRTLEHLIAHHPRDAAVPMAASLLLADEPSWRPRYGRGLNLQGAVLRGARWSVVNLSGAVLTRADLTDADLRHADLSVVTALDADLQAANLGGADLHGASFASADFNSANLSFANLDKTVLDHANLTGVAAASATFREARLRHVEVKDGHFPDTDFSGAWFVAVHLSRATSWNRAAFRRATFNSCNLEDLVVEAADFNGADLTGSLLTGSRMPRAKFNGAILANTGLAEIDWEDADLRAADLTHASFHLGSSRSGLVGSTIPSEGSKTGFYTDDFNEQDYKSPEEIRKAALVGADLRGAKLVDTDFYLVDLRRAHYTADQHRHFVQCGAILLSRGGDAT